LKFFQAAADTVGVFVAAVLEVNALCVLSTPESNATVTFGVERQAALESKIDDDKIEMSFSLENNRSTV
jgi:Cu/Ag efflux protein CusF